MLKLALIENLRRIAEDLIEGSDARRQADRLLARLEAGEFPSLPPAPLHSAFVTQLRQRVHEADPRVSALHADVQRLLGESGTTSEDAVRAEYQRQATDQASTANSITSLGLCATLDWSRFVERVSMVERVLRRDPSGVHLRMDFASRDRYRQAVEEIADPTGEAQVRVALRAVESARQVAEKTGSDDRAAHVGYHLIGPGRRDLEIDVAFHPRFFERLRRFAFRHAIVGWLSGIGLLTALGVAAAMEYERAQGHADAAFLAGLLVLLPASQLAVLIVQRLVNAFVPPRRLVRLDLSSGVPESARTMVVVPTLLGSVAGVERLVAHLEVQALGNMDAHVHFAILSDFRDAASAEMPGDSAILAAARQGIEELNRRYGPDRFFLFHRERKWNPKEAVFMGWERKRGKLEEFNGLLRGEAHGAFPVQVGDATLLRSVKYVLTLDTDTRLPRNAAQTLIGILAHPLNRPVFDRSVGRVVEGYGILQPRVSVMYASAAGSLFARVYAGHTGVDPYTTAVSDAYQDLFGEGIFTGKGLYDVDAFRASVEARVPENALLSHDLFEGLHARTGLVSDVELVDDFPSNVLAHARRQHRWMRGDWQILAWLFPVVPTRRGFAKNRLPLVSQWKILDNLRRSLVAPALLLFFAAAWTVLPGNPLVFTLAGLAVAGFPLVDSILRFPRKSRDDEPMRVYARGILEEIATSLAQAFLTLALLPFHAWETIHAVGVTLVRVVVTGRRLLDWETAAAQAKQTAELLSGGVRAFAVEMAASPAAAAAILIATAALRPSALPLALPFLVLWALAPLLAYGLSHPAPSRRLELTAGDRERLRAIARPHVEILRDARRAGGPLPAPRQPPGDAGAPRRAPDLADEHRHGAPLLARRVRPRASRPSTRCSRGSTGRSRRWRASSGTRATSSTGTTRGRSRRSRRGTSRPSTAATSPERSSRSPRAASRSRGRTPRSRRGSRTSHAARARSPTGCASASSSIPSASSSPSASGSPTRRGRDGSTSRPTTSSPPRRASRASSRSPRATSRRTTGSTSGGSS